jgi:LCP family protein required for cell wall assembly
MRYLDLGVLPAPPPQKPKNGKKKFIFIGTGLLLVTLIAVVGYAFYWPLSSLLGQIFKDPGIVLSFLKKPSGQLQSTDGKTNFLLLGIDKRSSVPYTYVGAGGEEQHNGFLSDTVVVASVDQSTKEVTLISIPRDTWVQIPAWEGFKTSYGKINSTYSLGDRYNYPGGGLKLIKSVVESHLGVPIHYGLRVDFEGFKKGIDTLGGVDVVVDKTFDDYKYPVEGQERANCAGYYCRFEHIHFDAGPTHMDGSTALKFSRSRSGTSGEGSDFARAKRQQKIIQAALAKALSTETLFDPVKLNNLFEDFGNTVETDFDLTSIPQAIKLAREINLGNMKTFVLDPASGLMKTGNAAQYGGAYVIVPKDSWDTVKAKIRDLLFPPPLPEGESG